MAFFVPPSLYLVHHQLSLVYQFWLHTEVIGKLGPIEYIFNTPSHHRVHHGQYLPSNGIQWLVNNFDFTKKDATSSAWTPISAPGSSSGTECSVLSKKNSTTCPSFTDWSIRSSPSIPSTCRYRSRYRYL